jgi:predicted esterase
VDHIIKILKDESYPYGKAERVFVGGYELGASIALHAYLKFKSELGELGGVFCANGAVIGKFDWNNIDINAKLKTPLMCYHGELPDDIEDDTIPFPQDFAYNSYKLLNEKGLKFEWFAQRLK